MIRETEEVAKNVKYYSSLRGYAIKSINNMENFERLGSDYPNYTYFVPEDGEWVTQREDGTQVVTSVKRGTLVLCMYSATDDRLAKEVFFVELDELKDYYNRKQQFLEDKKNNTGGDNVGLLQ